MNFNCQPFMAKELFLKVVHPLKIYKQMRFRGPALTGARFAATSDVSTSAILEWLSLRDKNYGV
jgi:hypothetical protein